MNYPIAYIKGVKADIAKREITVTIIIDFNQDNIATSEELALYADPDAGSVSVSILPRQMALKLAREFNDALPDGIDSVTLEANGRKVTLK